MEEAEFLKSIFCIQCPPWHTKPGHMKYERACQAIDSEDVCCLLCSAGTIHPYTLAILPVLSASAPWVGQSLDLESIGLPHDSGERQGLKHCELNHAMCGPSKWVSGCEKLFLPGISKMCSKWFSGTTELGSVQMSFQQESCVVTAISDLWMIT